MSTASAALPIVFQHYVLRSPLSEFAGLFWYWRGHEVRYSKERILPMGTVELVVNLGGGNAGISGPQSEAFIIERRVHDELLGVHFNLGGAFPFLPFPAGELHGLSLTLADLWGEQKASELVCRLNEAKAIQRKFEVLEQWLMRYFDQAHFNHDFRQFSGLSPSAYLPLRTEHHSHVQVPD